MEIKLNKNLIQCIVRQADDRTILNLLSARKDLYEDDFFQIIFNERYPLLKHFKSEKSETLEDSQSETTWRSFYIEMVDKILKLKEEFDIDYIRESPQFNPADLYENLKSLEEARGKETAVLVYKEEIEPFFIGSSGNLKLLKEYLRTQESKFYIIRLYEGALDKLCKVSFDKLCKVSFDKLCKVSLDSNIESNHLNFIRYLSSNVKVPYQIIGYTIETKNKELIYYIESKAMEEDLSENELDDMYSTAVLASIHINDFSLVEYFLNKLIASNLNYDFDDFFIFLTERIAQSAPEDKRILDIIYEKLPNDYKELFISSLMYNIVLEDNVNNVPLLIHIYYKYFSGLNSKQRESFIKSLLYESEGLEKMNVYNAFLNSLNSKG